MTPTHPQLTAEQRAQQEELFKVIKTRFIEATDRGYSAKQGDPNYHEQAAISGDGKFSLDEIKKAAPRLESFTQKWVPILIREHNQNAMMSGGKDFTGDVAETTERIWADFLGLGPIQYLLKDESTEDVVINGPLEVLVKRHGRWEDCPDIKFESSESILVKLNRAIAHTGQQAGTLIPIVDATLRSGHRVNIVSHPLAEPWPVISIRRRRDIPLTMSDLVRRGGPKTRGLQSSKNNLPAIDYSQIASSEGVLSPEAALFLHLCALAGSNILVIGETGSGKTSLMNVIAGLIPDDRRIVAIEDTRELNIRPPVEGRPHNCVYFTTRSATVEGVAAIRQDALVRAALRQRPDALLVGECRGGEIFELLKALSTGHRNGITSVHAESVAEVHDRVKMMLQEAQFSTELSEATISLWIAKAFQVALVIRGEGEGRFIREIVEFTGGVEGGRPIVNTLFSDTGRGLELKTLRLHQDRLWQQQGFAFAEIFKNYLKRM